MYVWCVCVCVCYTIYEKMTDGETVLRFILNLATIVALLFSYNISNYNLIENIYIIRIYTMRRLTYHSL